MSERRPPVATRAVAGLVAAAVGGALLVSCGQAKEKTAPTPSPRPTSTATPTGSPSSSPDGSASPSRSPTPRPTATSPRPSPTATNALPAWLRGRVVTVLPTSRKVVALTFDGGAGNQGLASIVATLAREHVPATFFLTARFVDANSAAVRAIAKAGHVVGDHTVTHPHATTLSDAALTREVTAAATAITAATGRSPKPWFRFPYGEYDTRTLRVVNQLGYGAIGWTLDTKGYLGREAGTAADVVRRVRAGLKPGATVLMHVGANPDDGTTYDADALPDVIAAIRAAGYSFVTVASFT